MPVSKRKAGEEIASVEDKRAKEHSVAEQKLLQAENDCQVDFAYYKTMRAMKGSMDMYLSGRASVLRDDSQSLLLIDAQFAEIDRRFELIQKKYHALKFKQIKLRIPVPCKRVRLFTAEDENSLLRVELADYKKRFYDPIYDMKQLADKVRDLYQLDSRLKAVKQDGQADAQRNKEVLIRIADVIGDCVDEMQQARMDSLTIINVRATMMAGGQASQSRLDQLSEQAYHFVEKREKACRRALQASQDFSQTKKRFVRVKKSFVAAENAIYAGMKGLIADIMERECKWRQSPVYQNILKGDIEQQLQAFDVESVAPVPTETAVAVCR